MYRRITMLQLALAAVVSSSAMASKPALPEIEVQKVVGVPADPQPLEPIAEQPVPGPDLPDLTPTPMRIHRKEDGGVSRSQREMISFDLRTRIARRQPAAPDLPGATQEVTQGGRGELLQPEAELAKDFSGLVLIPHPELGIYPRHVRITMKFRNQNGVEYGGACSGTLIDPKHVITAGHCIYSQEDDDGVAVDDWAYDVKVWPGYNNGASEIGSARGVQLHSWTGWTDDFDYDHDIAIIDLDRPVGALTGWRAFGHNPDFAWYETGTWWRFSYPGSDFYDNPVYDGQQMYLNVGTYDFDDDPRIGYDRDMYKGTSGSGAVRDNAVYAVVSHGELGGSYIYSWDTRITSGKFNDIHSFLNADRPATVDLVALDVQTEETGDVAGNAIDGLTFLAHNYSTVAFDGTVYYAVYLSSNATISSGDHYVTSGSASVNLGPLGSARIDASATAYVPQLPGDSYTLGVIITNSDANSGNNTTQGDDTAPFGVFCQVQGAPVLASPDHLHPCIPTSVTLEWAPVPGVGVQYQLEFGLNPNGGAIYNTSSTQYLATGLQPGSSYYWRVRATAPCGAYGQWSPLRTFWVQGILNDVSRNEPAPDRTCLDTTVQFTWDHKPQASLYRIWIMDLAGGNNYYVDSSTTSAQYSGLIPGTRYFWAIKARDACGNWGEFGERSAFYIKAPAALTPVQVSPAAAAFTGADVLFSAQAHQLTSGHEFEIQTAAGQPAYQQQVAGDALWVLSMAEGAYRWRVRAQTCTTGGDVWGPWTGWRNFTVDRTGPQFVAPPTSTSHTVGVWSTASGVGVQWQPATDNHGVSTYWVAWDQNPDTVPDGAMAIAGTSAAWSFVEGDNNWFHIVAVDLVGNISAPHHLGPFRIDQSAPASPVLTASVPSGGYVNANDLTVSWSAVTDAGSGVAGYSVAWSTSNSYQVDNTVDTTALSSTLAGVSEGARHFYIKAVDNLGNATAQQRYTITVDRTAPWVQLWEPNGGEVYPSGSTVGIDFMTNDNLGPATLCIEHAYSVDGGSRWYDIVFEATGPGGTPTQCNGTNGPGAPNNTWWDVPWVPPGSQVLYRVTAIDRAGNRGERVSQNPFTIEVATGVQDLPAVTAFDLAPNSPNPFNPRTTIRFSLAAAADVRLTIFDARGRLVRTLVDDHRQGPSQHEAVWDGTDDRGTALPSGVYVYHLQAGEFTQSRPMILVK